MIFKFSQLIFIAILFSMTVVCVNAQSDAPEFGKPGATGKEKDDFPKGIKETLAKGRIEREKKDFEELVQNGEEAAQLSESLEKTFAESNKLSVEDQKKLDRLEKLAKKIRRELGANDNGNEDATEEVENPSSLRDAFRALQSSTGKLVAELKKTTRYSISVLAIQSSNAFLKVVKFIRFGKN
jgi:membrane-associated HD superfamily phosphohydrolase